MDVVLVSGSRQVGRTSKLLELSVRRILTNKNGNVIFVSRNNTDQLSQRVFDLVGVTDFKHIQPRVHFITHHEVSLKENIRLQRNVAEIITKLPVGDKIDSYVFDCDRFEAAAYLLSVSKAIEINMAEVIFLGRLITDECVPYSNLSVTQL